VRADFISVLHRKGNCTVPMGLLSSVIYSREFQLENSVKPGKNNKDGHLMLAFGETASC